ncbi:MAG: hypothetical protein AB8B63_12665 [Granulosicoccus sp.]
MNTEASQHQIPETDKSLIEAELLRLLAEKKFAGAPQMSAFLRYIVSQTLEGNANRIKAYSVGVDALGKPDSFDAQNDPSVRVLALRLRKTLSSIYEADAPAHAIVALRVGTYVPDFYKVASASQRAESEDEPDCRQTLGFSYEAKPSHNIPDKAVGQYCDELAHVVNSDRQDNTARAMHSASTALCNQSSVVESTKPITTLTGKRGGVSKVLMAGALVLTAGLWQFGDINTVGAKTSHGTALALMGSTDDSRQSLLEPPEKMMPTLYYESDAEQQNIAGLMGLLLSSRLVQSGSVKVINFPGTHAFDIDTLGSYQLIVGELIIEGQTTLEAQIVNLQTGEVLDSSTLNFEQNNGEFSRQEIDSVELLAMNISSLHGPLYQDYCLHAPDDVSCGLAY